jgi:aldehyde dehydrogenase (NAD+)
VVSRLLPTFWNKPSEIITQIDRKKHMSTNITKKLEGKVALVTGGHHDEARTENRRPHAIRDFARIYINGEWVKPLGGKVIDIINPATERPAGQITLGTAADVDRAVAAAQRAFITFSRSSRQERLDLLSRILEVYLKRQDDLADALTEELGAPKRFAKERQVGVGILHLQTAIAVLKDYQFEYPQSTRTIIRREPIGAVGMITPWNWPINQLVVKAFPAFATGCTVVHKPSEVAPFTAHLLAEIFHEAGLPAGVYNLVDGDGPTVGAAISAHPGINMVSFTGSIAAGIDVAKRAADSVKRVHQELGGKSPNIILDDADLAAAVTYNIYRLMLNSGQGCAAPTRMLVPFDKMDTAKSIAKQVVASITYGDPQTDVYMGPVVSERQWKRIQSMISKGIEEGATLLVGGTGRPDGLEIGYYVKPTVFVDVTNDMTIAREEIFGPVLCIIGYKDVDDAVSIANDTVYGLAAYVQSASEERATEIAARIEAGMVFINGASVDPEAPFGGYKMSGNGREWGEFAFGEFLETKAVIHSKPV